MPVEEIIFFFSRFSPNCKKTTSYLQQTNIAFPIQFVCVDSKDIRKIIRSKNFSFTLKGVPTISVIHSDGNAEIYEGDKVLSWFKSQIEKLSAKALGPNEEDELPSEAEPEGGGDSELISEADDDIVIKNTAPKAITIKDIAKTMEEQRKKSLGINDDNQHM